MKPVIGITMTKVDNKYSLNQPYVQSILDAGGLPFCIPFGVENDASQVIESIDGIVLTGGVDIHPHYFMEEPHPKLGEVMLERDKVEIVLTHMALKKKLPILAICRGIQILNVALGGTLYQDIEAQYEKKSILHQQRSKRHEASHFVEVEPRSKLFEIVGKGKIAVNSLHHQAVKGVSPVLNVVAKASDGIIEAVEMDDYPFCLAVQWHPEEMAVSGDQYALKLFEAFIEASSTQQ